MIDLDSPSTKVITNPSAPEVKDSTRESATNLIFDKEGFVDKIISDIDATDIGYKKSKAALSSATRPTNKIETYKKVDGALFNAYLNRLTSLLNDVASQDATEIRLTQIIKISEAYTVSIRTEKVFRLFISAIILIIRNNYERLKDPGNSQRLLGALKKYMSGRRDIQDYDAFKRACYMAGLSSLNRPK